MSARQRVRRELRPGDLGRIVAHHERVYPAEYGVDSSFVEHVAAGVAAARERGFPSASEGIWIVEHDGEHAGSVACTDEGDGTAMLRWVLLDPGLRGHGLGRGLIGEAVAFAERCGYERLALMTFSDLRAAGHLYREHGFAVVEEETGPRWGRASVTYQRYERGFQRRAQSLSSASAGSSSRPFSVSA